MSGYLLYNMLLFGRILRGLGLDVNPGRITDLVHALDHINISHKTEFYHAARSLLVHSHGDIPLFDQAFDLFWRTHETGAQIDLSALLQSMGHSQLIVTQPSLQLQLTQDNNNIDLAADATTTVELTRTYDARETLRQKDFSDLTGAELQSIKRMMASIAWQLGQRRTRRQQPGQSQRVDMRRTLRRSMRYGGELLHWEQREYRQKSRPLVIIADISGSMERYTRLLLHFTYSLAAGVHQQVETFVFSTRLTRVTRQLKGHSVEKALQEVSQVVHDWSGGTRIGEALKAFNFDWGRRILRRSAVALLISDGWDRGDPHLLQTEISRLQRNCFRLIWLNPLLGSSTYEPLTLGMQTALPYVDDFLPVHNLASLEDLAIHLKRVSVIRPMRRQLKRLR